MPKHAPTTRSKPPSGRGVRWDEAWTADVSAQQSRRMARIRGKHTTPERVVRGIVHRLGGRYSLHRRDLPGRPDLTLARHGKVIDVRGCYWHAHACQRHRRRTVRPEYWGPELARNVERDGQNLRRLRRMGWKVLVVWECETADVARLTRRLARFLAAAPGAAAAEARCVR